MARVARGAVIALVLAMVAAACTGAEPTAPASPVTTTAPLATPLVLSGPTQAPASPSSPTPGYAGTPAPSAAAYRGRLFDTHLHTQFWSFRGESPEVVLRFLAQEGTEWAMGFFKLSVEPHTTTGPTLSLIRGTQGRIIPLLRPWTPDEASGDASLDFAQGKFTDAVFRRYLRPQGPLQGVGEINLNRRQLQPITFDGPQMDVAIRAASEIKGVIMVHPSGLARGRLAPVREYEPALRKYPDVSFIFHGSAAALDHVEPLMARYPNVYFTWDTQLMLQGPWQPKNLMYPAGIGAAGSSQQFETDLERVGMEAILKEALTQALPRFQKHPDRVLWGTDRAQPWHFDTRARDRIIEVSRRFIAGLPAELQEPYASGNALRVLGRLLAH